MKASRILIIDQDDVFIRHVQAYFTTLGVDVISADEGTEGYRLAKTRDPGGKVFAHRANVINVGLGTGDAD